MDEVQENEPDKHGLAAEPIIDGYSLAESRFGLNSGLYFDENLDKGLGSGDASSIFYYGLNYDAGGLNSSASVEGKDVFKDRNLDMVPSEDGAVDLFSSTGLSNASENLCWDFDLSKKFPDLDYQFPQASDSWNSSLVSQSSGSSNKAVGVSELSSQIIKCQKNQPERLITCDVNGNYMTPFELDMLVNDETGVNSSYSCDPQFIGDIKYIASPVDTSESYHFSNNGYFGTSHANNLMMAPSTSLSMQCYDASLMDEGTKAVHHSLQAVSINKPAYSYDLQDFSEVSPVDTSESYHCSNEGYLGISHDLNHLTAPCSSFSVQCSDASLVDANTKAGDHSFLSVLVNKPAFSCDLQNLSEASPLYISGCYDHRSNERYVGASHDLQDLSEISLVDEDTEADHHTLQGVSVNNIADSSNVQDIGQVNIAASPMETRESYHGSNEGYFGTSHDLNLLGKSFTSMFMQFSDPSLVDEDTEADDPLWQDLLTSKPIDSIGEPISVSSPVDTGESYYHSSEGNVATSNDFDFIPQGLSHNSIFVQETEVSPMVEDTDEDDPTLQSILINKRAKCKKVGPHHRQKRVLKPLQRCSNDPPAIKTRLLRRRKEEPSNSSKRKHVEAISQNKCHRKRIKDGAMVAHDAVTSRSSKEDLDSDDEYDPFHSNLKVGRSKKGNGGRKNNKLWTLSEVIKLVDGVAQFGVGKWTAIQKTFSGSPPCRTSLDIRDKWRNLIRTSGLRLKYMKEDESSPKYGSIPLPKSLLEKICELDRAQPYLRSAVSPPQNRGHDLVDSSSE